MPLNKWYNKPWWKTQDTKNTPVDKNKKGTPPPKSIHFEDVTKKNDGWKPV